MGARSKQLLQMKKEKLNPRRFQIVLKHGELFTMLLHLPRKTKLNLFHECTAAAYERLCICIFWGHTCFKTPSFFGRKETRQGKSFSGKIAPLNIVSLKIRLLLELAESFMMAAAACSFCFARLCMRVCF